MLWLYENGSILQNPFSVICENNNNYCHRCMIKIFRGEGVVDGEGGSSEGGLKWGVIKGSFQKHLEAGGE